MKSPICVRGKGLFDQEVIRKSWLRITKHSFPNKIHLIDFIHMFFFFNEITVSIINTDNLIDIEL
jgi:hypothetical protein